MNLSTFNKSKPIILTLIFSFILTVFSGTSFAEGSKDSSCNTDTVSVPEVKFIPKLIAQHTDKEGNVVSEFSQLPDKFVTDENGNIITQDTVERKGGITTQACEKRYYYETIAGPISVKSNSFIANHPGFNKWDKVNGYYFGQATVSYSVGLEGFAGVSVSVSVAGPGNGTFITANAGQWSRPGIFGDVTRTTRKVTVQDPCNSRNNTSYNQITYQTKNTYNKTIYQ